MVTEVNAVTFRQNPGEMLNQVQRGKEGILIEDGQPVAALVEASCLPGSARYAITLIA